MSTESLVAAHIGTQHLPIAKENLIPSKLDTYIPFGNHDMVYRIIKSKVWHPFLITGLSGNGKTTSVLQCCAELGRECIRVNITCETDEDDLLGGFRLANGNTEFSEGPVVQAMKRGAILILDEVDLASNRIMCLQPILEGQPVFLKKIGVLVKPAPGFNIALTANTKGQGNDSGKFVGTNVMNEAFLDRIPNVFEQEYPEETTEVKILESLMGTLKCVDNEFAANLVKWANGIRTLYAQGDMTDIISTRRLIHIVQGFKIFGGRLESIIPALARFEPETSKAMLSYYEMLDASVGKTSQNMAQNDDTVTIPGDGATPPFTV